MIKSFATFASQHLLLDSGYRAAGNSNFGFNTTGVGARRADLPKFADFHPLPDNIRSTFPCQSSTDLKCCLSSGVLGSRAIRVLRHHLLNSFSKEFGVGIAIPSAYPMLIGVFASFGDW